MIKKLHFIKSILRSKNAQIRSIREIAEAQESANVILSAYIAILAKKRGEVRIAKSDVSAALGSYRVTCAADGDFYVITVQGGGEEG